MNGMLWLDGVWAFGFVSSLIVGMVTLGLAWTAQRNRRWRNSRRYAAVALLLWGLAFACVWGWRADRLEHQADYQWQMEKRHLVEARGLLEATKAAYERAEVHFQSLLPTRANEAWIRHWIQKDSRAHGAAVRLAALRREYLQVRDKVRVLEAGLEASVLERSDSQREAAWERVQASSEFMAGPEMDLDTILTEGELQELLLMLGKQDS